MALLSARSPPSTDRFSVPQARWQAWLEEQIAKGKEVTEWDAAKELTKYRKIGENFADVSLGGGQLEAHSWS